MNLEENKNEKEIERNVVVVKPSENLINKKINYGIIGSESNEINPNDEVRI